MTCSQGWCYDLHNAGPKYFPCLGSYVSLLTGGLCVVSFVYVLMKMFKNNRRALAGYTKNTVSIDVHMTLLSGVALWAVGWASFHFFELDSDRLETSCMYGDDLGSNLSDKAIRIHSVAVLSNSVIFGGTSFLEGMILLLLISPSIGYNTFRRAWIVAGVWAGAVILGISITIFFFPGGHNAGVAYENLNYVLIARDAVTVLMHMFGYVYQRRNTPDRTAVRRYACYMVCLDCAWILTTALLVYPDNIICNAGICLKDLLLIFYVLTFPPLVYIVLKRDSQYWTSDVHDDEIFTIQEAFTDELARSEVPNYRDVVIPKTELYYRYKLEERVDLSVETHLWRRQLVVLKQFKFDILTRDNIILFKTEANIFRQLRHENIVRFYGVCINPPAMGIVMEYCPNGDLFKLLETRRTAYLASRSDCFSGRSDAVSEEDYVDVSKVDSTSGLSSIGDNTFRGYSVRLPFFNRSTTFGSSGLQVEAHFDAMKAALDVARGMQYLHSRNCMHRDLKSMNVLLDVNWNAKIADFGETEVISTRQVSQEPERCKNPIRQLGTPGWAAPELLLGQDCNKTADVFSYGVILWELMTWLPPHVYAPVGLCDHLGLRSLPSASQIPISTHTHEATTLTQRSGSFGTIDHRPLLSPASNNNKSERTIVSVSADMEIEANDLAALHTLTPEPIVLVEVSNMKAATSLMAKHRLRPSIPNQVPQAFRQMLEKCWSHNMDERPSFTNIVQELEAISKIAPITMHTLPMEAPEAINRVTL